jgi:hypothetical protein
MQFMPLNAEYSAPKQCAFGLGKVSAMPHLNLRHYRGLVGVGIGNLIPLPNLIQGCDA